LPGLQISRDVEDEDVFSVSADWRGRRDLETYMRSTSGAALLGALDLLSDRAAAGSTATREKRESTSSEG